MGYQQFDVDAQYDCVDWSIGIYRPSKGIVISLVYYDKDIDVGGFCGDRHNNLTDRFDVAYRGRFDRNGSVLALNNSMR